MDDDDFQYVMMQSEWEDINYIFIVCQRKTTKMIFQQKKNAKDKIERDRQIDIEV